MGARPFERLFEEKIKKPLAKHILFGKLKNTGGRVNVDISGDEIGVVVLDPVLELITN
jgi:ATP-dependent Clp protease ATP-binding subunit ClpA